MNLIEQADAELRTLAAEFEDVDVIAARYGIEMRELIYWTIEHYPEFTHRERHAYTAGVLLGCAIQVAMEREEERA